MANSINSMKHISRLISLICISSLLLSGCSLAGMIPSFGQPDRRVAAAALGTATPTPFKPSGVLVTEEPPIHLAPDQPTEENIPQDPWGFFPAPSEVSAIEIPPPMPEIQLSDRAVTFVLLGTDQRGGGGYRTDTMMIVVVDPAQDSVTALSVLRDLYVYIPGWKVERINTADPRGGEEMLRNTILYNFGIPVDYWIRMNFNGFVTAIDRLGGIDVEVTGYLYDEYGGIWYNYGPGTYHMNGVQALGYVRMRKNSSDFDRLRRQQEVVSAIFKKVVTLDGLSRIPDLYEQFNVLFQTNIGLAEILPLIPMASKVASGSADLQAHALTENEVSSWTVPYSGAAVLLPKRDAMIGFLSGIFSE
jgi:polyisoprenyl-teichoic acid--peptidoglycan teichoic acid transferase